MVTIGRNLASDFKDGMRIWKGLGLHYKDGCRFGRDLAWVSKMAGDWERTWISKMAGDLESCWFQRCLEIWKGCIRRLAADVIKMVTEIWGFLKRNIQATGWYQLMLHLTVTIKKKIVLL